MKRILILGSVVLLLAAIAAPTAAAGHMRPFEGRWVGPDQFDFGHPGCPPNAALRFTNDGVGQFTHLGRTLVSMTHCTFVESAPVPTSGWSEGGVMTLTAANGDTLTLTYEATFTMTPNSSGPEPPYESAEASFEWTIAAGTGRFDGAEGSGTGTSTDDMLAAIQTFRFTGEIAY